MRPADSGSGGGGTIGIGGGGGSDYEPGEVRRDQPPPYSRSNRFHDDHGLYLLSFFSVNGNYYPFAKVPS